MHETKLLFVNFSNITNACAFLLKHFSHRRAGCHGSAQFADPCLMCFHGLIASVHRHGLQIAILIVIAILIPSSITIYHPSPYAAPSPDSPPSPAPKFTTLAGYSLVNFEAIDASLLNPTERRVGEFRGSFFDFCVPILEHAMINLKSERF